MRPEYEALDAYRLEKDWSWPQLSAAMRDAGALVPSTTLHHLLKRAHADEQPRERTLHKIRKFLAHARATDPAAFPPAPPTEGDAHV